MIVNIGRMTAMTRRGVCGLVVVFWSLLSFLVPLNKTTAFSAGFLSPKVEVCI